MAIAFGNEVQTSVAGGTATATTGTITITGSNTIGFALIENQNLSGLSAAPTWNGVPMTLIDSQADGGVTIGYIYAIVNPGTGTVSVTRSATTNNMALFAAYYTGAAQTTTPDAKTKGTTVAASFTGTLTTVADNSWQILVCYTDNGSQAAGTGSTLRGSVISTIFGMYDSNGPKTPAGSKSMTVTCGASSNINYVMVSFAPVAVAVTNSNFLAFM